MANNGFEGLTNQFFVMKTGKCILAVYYNPKGIDPDRAYEGATKDKLKIRLSYYNERGTTGTAEFNLDVAQFSTLEMLYDLAISAETQIRLERIKGAPIIPAIEAAEKTGLDVVPRQHFPKVLTLQKDAQGLSPVAIMDLSFQYCYQGEPKRNPWTIRVRQGSAPAGRSKTGGVNFTENKMVLGKTKEGFNKDVSVMMSMADYRRFIEDTRALINNVNRIHLETILPEFMQAWSVYKGDPIPMPGLAGKLEKIEVMLAQLQQAMGMAPQQQALSSVMQKALAQAQQRDARNNTAYSQPAPQGPAPAGRNAGYASPLPQAAPQGFAQPRPAAGGFAQGPAGPQGFPGSQPAPAGPMAPMNTQAFPQQPPAGIQGFPMNPPVTGQAPVGNPAPMQAPPAGMPVGIQQPSGQPAPAGRGPVPPMADAPAPAGGGPVPQAAPSGQMMDLRILADQATTMHSGLTVMRCQDAGGKQMSLTFKGPVPEVFFGAQKSNVPVKARYSMQDLPGIGKTLVFVSF